MRASAQDVRERVVRAVNLGRPRAGIVQLACRCDSDGKVDRASFAHRSRIAERLSTTDR